MRTLSENASQNPFYCKTLSKPPCVVVQPLRRAPNNSFILRTIQKISEDLGKSNKKPKSTIGLPQMGGRLIRATLVLHTVETETVNLGRREC